ncbi:hypothetical protein D9M72_497660 [compost metagenome]
MAPPDVLFEGSNGVLGITDDMYHGLSCHFGIEFHDGGLINLILARRELLGIADDVGDPRRDRVIEVGMLRSAELRL